MHTGLLLLSLALLALSVSAHRNPEAHLFVFGDSRYPLSSYSPLLSSLNTVSKGKLNTVLSPSISSSAAIETSLAVNVPGNRVQRRDMVFIGAFGDSCAALEAFAANGTRVTKVDGYIFFGCYPTTLGSSSSAPRLVLVGELDGVNTVDNVVALATEQSALNPRFCLKRGVFVLPGVTNAHFANGVRAISYDVSASFARSSASATNMISTIVVDFAGSNFLQPTRSNRALFNTLKTFTSQVANAFKSAAAYDQESACVEYQETVLNVLPDVLPDLTYQNTYFGVSNDFVLSKSNATSDGLVDVTSHIFPAETSNISQTKGLLACKGRSRAFFADRVYGNASAATLFGPAKDGRDVHASQFESARSYLNGAQLARLTSSGRTFVFEADTNFPQGNLWVPSNNTAIKVNSTNPNQFIIGSATLQSGWPTAFTKPACAAVVGIPVFAFSDALFNQVCNDVFLGNSYHKFIGVKGALLLQMVTAFR